jgi:hypothetical protein
MEKIQLHSDIGCLSAVMLRCMMWTAFLSPPVIFLVGQQIELPIRVVVSLEQLAIGIVVALFLRRYVWRLYATDDGIELGSPASVVPWSEVEALRDLGPWTGLIEHLHRLSFRSQRRSITFYARVGAADDVNRFLARYGGLSEKGGSRGGGGK